MGFDTRGGRKDSGIVRRERKKKFLKKKRNERKKGREILLRLGELFLVGFIEGVLIVSIVRTM